jgi:hypothetical protein
VGLFDYERNCRYGAASEYQDIGVGDEIRKNEKRDTGEQWNERFLFLAVYKKSETYRAEYHGPDNLRGVSHLYSSLQRSRAPWVINLAFIPGLG